MDADANSPSQMLSQIFGHQIDESISHLNGCNRNQYREVERFETEDELQQWMLSQGKKWGIVQKGRVTIEDIIDQYACVFRRRKGYACKVQMRVRHNRRNGHKVVEILELDHDHTFYGYKSGFEPGEGGKMFASASGGQFCAQTADFGSGHQQEEQQSKSAAQLNAQFDENEEEEGQGGAELLELIKQEQFDLSNLVPPGEEMGAEQPLQHQQDEMGTLSTQPMEMLLNNILNNAQQNRGFGISFGGGEGSGEGFEGAFGIDGGQMALVEQQNEALAERVAEKMAKFLSSQMEPKFASILSELHSLNKSVEELKRTVATAHSPPQRRGLISVPGMVGSSGSGGSSTTKQTMLNGCQNYAKAPISTGGSATPTKIAFRPYPMNNGSLRYQQHNNAKAPAENAVNLAIGRQTAQQQQQHHQRVRLINTRNDFAGGTDHFPPASSSAADNVMKFPPLKNDFKLMPLTSSSSSTNCGENAILKMPFSSSSIPWATTKPSTNALEPPKLTKMGAVGLKNGRRSVRKSVHAYRQRRKELSYRHMKEIGLTLVINGVPKSIFHCRVTDITNAVQTKRRELAQQGQRVFYRGRDVTDALYRVECSRVMVNGRRCGQMIADSLWPRGFFRQRMLMPILRGVSHRTKRRTDGTMREAVANDQFEVFKEALLRLGGFLMDEPDRYKWMETAREGVNQRGLDELANSKRAHFEFEGGPLFGDEIVGGEEQQQIGIDNETAQLLTSKLFASSYSELPANLLLAENGQYDEDDEGMEEEEENGENAEGEDGQSPAEEDEEEAEELNL
ncbi:hypothetical protein niasHS_003363 [Heterodera schachtii]|uniref:FAR1 domain-containing protein n=1 Tax=Heterodera schachtii TaxID=97005 RepID=A0ABD2KGB4_HETSC